MSRDYPRIDNKGHNPRWAKNPTAAPRCKVPGCYSDVVGWRHAYRSQKDCGHSDLTHWQPLPPVPHESGLAKFVRSTPEEKSVIFRRVMSKAVAAQQEVIERAAAIKDCKHEHLTPTGYDTADCMDCGAQIMVPIGKGST